MNEVRNYDHVAIIALEMATNVKMGALITYFRALLKLIGDDNDLEANEQLQAAEEFGTIVIDIIKKSDMDDKESKIKKAEQILNSFIKLRHHLKDAVK